MKILQLVQKQNLTAPVFTLAVASFVCCALVAYRVIVGCEVRHAYLVWNLFLAWLPLMFALFAVERLEIAHQALEPTPDPSKEGNRRSAHVRSPVPLPGGVRGGFPQGFAVFRDRKFIALAIAWLLFFPNAPYIFTDLVHISLAKGRPTFWTELMLILLVAMTGFFAGFLSLQVMHGFGARLWGRVAGWGFVMGVSGLAGFGVYLGRFTRLNSWDVLWNPVRLIHRTGMGVWNLATQTHHAKFFILFSLFLLLGYVMLHAMTLRRAHGESLRADGQ
jgi:uncharacterized membrane protein